MGKLHLCALGQEIVLGNVYGYMQSRNGFSIKSIGIATLNNNQGITLANVWRSKTLTGNEPDYDKGLKNIGITSTNLFPIDESLLPMEISESMIEFKENTKNKK